MEAAHNCQYPLVAVRTGDGGRRGVEPRPGETVSALGTLVVLSIEKGKSWVNKERATLRQPRPCGAVQQLINNNAQRSQKIICSTSSKGARARIVDYSRAGAPIVPRVSGIFILGRSIDRRGLVDRRENQELENQGSSVAPVVRVLHTGDEGERMMLASALPVVFVMVVLSTSSLSLITRSWRRPSLLVRFASSIYVSADDVGGSLFEAASKGNLDIVKEICGRHVQVDEVINFHHPEHSSSTPVIIATRNGHSECLACIIAAGGDIDKPDAMAETPAALSCKLGHAACLRVLIAAGADLNARSRIGATAAYWAAFRGHADCLQMLSDAGADLHIRNSFGVSPQQMAAREGHTACLAVFS